MKRKHIPIKTKLAAALLQLGHIPFSQAQRMTDEEIIALYHFDHYPIPHSQGGEDVAWNLQAVLIAAHREKTAKKDIPQIAKTKRISREHEEFQRRLLTPRDERPPKKPTIRSRGFETRREKKPWPKK